MEQWRNYNVAALLLPQPDMMIHVSWCCIVLDIILDWLQSWQWHLCLSCYNCQLSWQLRLTFYLKLVGVWSIIFTFWLNNESVLAFIIFFLDWFRLLTDLKTPELGFELKSVPLEWSWSVCVELLDFSSNLYFNRPTQ